MDKTLVVFTVSVTILVGALLFLFYFDRCFLCSLSWLSAWLQWAQGRWTHHRFISIFILGGQRHERVNASAYKTHAEKKSQRRHVLAVPRVVVVVVGALIVVVA